jgi:hypothetical protein
MEMISGTGRVIAYGSGIANGSQDPTTLPQVVGTGADGYTSPDYAKLTAFLIEVAKAQQAEIDQLRAALGLAGRSRSR